MTARLPILLIFAFFVCWACPGQAQSFYEAEAAGNLPSGGAVVETSVPGASGGSDVGYFTTRGASALKFPSVVVNQTRAYAVALRYSTARPWVSSMSVYVNDVDVTQALFPATGSWTTWATQTVVLNLQQGANSIMLRYDADDSGWINLDYIGVEPELGSAGFQPGSVPATSWFPPELSVDKFTGTAGVYVPLATVGATGVAVPLGLSYAATGVKVDDRGGEVGVNWVLSGEVSISRQVRGLPDDLDLYASATPNVPASSNKSRYGWLVYPSGTPEVV